ncbi:MAG: transmembrane protein [Bdellovibrio sp. ArHS]|uniref:DMT family transporter n=1 Tax=Bdellovibrio sp. ArHS TaxID=1569284 RepID=UPI000583A7FB|nr:DMT family transporter [Bdellovibrio sp. ArHS]KHD88202.1 MAG: transmembrane protein [Bdellovibrio sp. ArHS]
MALIKRASGPKPLTKNRAALELIFAGILWGFGFVATVWALRAFSATETLVFRFIVASIVGEILYLAARGPNFTTIREELLRALPAGLLLGGMLLLQTIGLKYTTATKSGFLTSLYVILVPLLNAWFFKAPSTLKNYLIVGLALGGTFILVDANLSGINVGDLWTLGCSVFAAFHIIYIGKISNRVGNAFRFNNFQSFWCLLALLPLYANQERSPWPQDMTPWLGILCLGLGSSIIAFYLQVRTQRVLSDSTASMLFLLESPFAALFGFLILHERLSLFQSLGAVIIMLASVLQIWLDPANKEVAAPPKSKSL